MTVRLEPPRSLHFTSVLPDQADLEYLTEGPALVRTREMSRWHRPRLGYRRDDGRVGYHTWCGQQAHNPLLERDEPLPGEPVCGTCDGRAVGAGQISDGPPDRQLLFVPRWSTPPKFCPGSRTMLAEELSGGRAARCLVCGDTHPLRCGGGVFSQTYGLAKHEPGAALIEPCPKHCWRHLTVRNGRAVCACTAGEAS